jgi:hypothetical protein
MTISLGQAQSGNEEEAGAWKRLVYTPAEISGFLALAAAQPTAARAMRAAALACAGAGAGLTGGRLVQEYDLRVVDQRRRQVQPSLHPARVGSDRPGQGVAQLDQLSQFGHPPGQRPAGHAVEPALQPQQLDAGLFGSSAASCSATPMRSRT